MHAEFVNPFLVSLLDVLKTMAQTELHPHKAELKQNPIARGDVSGLIGMIGPQIRGSFSVTFDAALAMAIYTRMVGEPVDELNEQVCDMVGEITNMVSGGAKRILGEKGYQFEMATPAVISGKNHTIIHKVKGPRITMPFESDNGDRAHIEICFDH